MTQLREYGRTAITHAPPAMSFVVEWTVGIVGVLAGLVGLYMYTVPTDWFLGGLVEGWYLGMFVAAGVLLGYALAMYARKAFVRDGAWTGGVVSGTAFSVVAFAAAVTFALVWIL